MEPALFEGIIFPDLNPVAFAIGPLVVRWYGLAYLTGILLGWFYLKKLNNASSHKVFSAKAYDDFIMWAVLGIILGGRLGYCLFYNFGYYVHNPIQIFMVWKGGMSFHGGLAGVITSMYLMSRRYRLDFLKAMDLCACIAPIGLFFGRIANFINAELYGRVTTVSWGVLFPGESLARHPSQIYEAALEGLLLFCIMNLLVWKTKAAHHRGMLSGIFLIGYGLFRSFVEFFREPDAQLGFILGQTTMGQLLCIPMIALGVFLLMRSHRTRHHHKAHHA